MTTKKKKTRYTATMKVVALVTHPVEAESVQDALNIAETLTAGEVVKPMAARWFDDTALAIVSVQSDEWLD